MGRRFTSLMFKLVNVKKKYYVRAKKYYVRAKGVCVRERESIGCEEMVMIMKR